jgi:tRNA A37 threonylcarbamoyladenosine biosynthesis protein TsaE
MQIDLSRNSTQTYLALFGSSVGVLFSLSLLASSLSFPKPARSAPLVGAGVCALGAAVFASRGLKPAHKWRVDEAAEAALFEIERENAMQELDEEDDARRYLDQYQRRVEIETAALERTLPLQIRLQQMNQVLNPLLIPVPGQFPGQPPINPTPQNGGGYPIGQPPPLISAPGQAPPQAYGKNPFAFDFKSLIDMDERPVIAIIGGMGAGKSKTVKYLAKHVFCSKEIRACDSFGRVQEWQGATIYPKAADIYALMQSDLDEIESESEEYRNGRSDFPERLTVLEEAPDALSELRRYNREANSKVPKNKRRDVPGDWLLKSLTYCRKLRRRAVFVSVSMSSTEFIPSEHRNKATVLFPGTAIDEAMLDTHYFRLGTAQNSKLREQLSQYAATLQNPCLVYVKGRWFVGDLPTLDLEGNPSAPPAAASTPPPTTAPTSIKDQLDQLFRQDFPEGETDR